MMTYGEPSDFEKYILPNNTGKGSFSLLHAVCKGKKQ